MDLRRSLWSTPLYSNEGPPSLYMDGQNLSNRTGRSHWKLHADVLNAQMHHKQQVYDYRTHHCQPLIAASASLLLSLLHYAMKYSNAIRQLQHQPSKLHVTVSSSCVIANNYLSLSLNHPVKNSISKAIFSEKCVWV